MIFGIPRYGRGRCQKLNCAIGAIVPKKNRPGECLSGSTARNGRKNTSQLFVRFGTEAATINKEQKLILIEASATILISVGWHEENANGQKKSQCS